MRILLDVDGVTADFMSQSFLHLRQVGGPAVTHQDIVTFDLLSFIPERFQSILLRTWKEQYFCATIPLYEGSQEAVRSLRELGEVIFVTAPLADSPHWHWERTQWIKEHFGSDGKDVIFATRKQHIVGDVLIDDRLDNLLDWQKAHPNGVPILWSVPFYARYSPTPPGVVSCNSWDELIDLIGALKQKLAQGSAPV